MSRGIRWIVSAALMALSACGSSGLPSPVLVDPHEPMTSEIVAQVSASATRPLSPETIDPAASQRTTREERHIEIEALAKSLWFGWYAAVAAGDVDALGNTVAATRIHADGVTAIATGALGFTETPRIEDYEFSVVEVLRDDVDCIVTALREDPTAFLAGGIVAERIGVFWLHANEWYLATSWTIDAPEFAWGDDCSLMVREYA